MHRALFPGVTWATGDIEHVVADASAGPAIVDLTDRLTRVKKADWTYNPVIVGRRHEILGVLDIPMQERDFYPPAPRRRRLLRRIIHRGGA